MIRCFNLSLNGFAAWIPPRQIRFTERVRGGTPICWCCWQAADASTFRSFVMSGLVKALDRAGLRHLLGKTVYDTALEVIEGWHNEFPGNITRLERALEEEYGLTLSAFKQDLKGKLADKALERFRTLHPRASGAPFSEADVIQRPADAYEAVANQIADHGYSGIFVIADEFTHLLEQLAQGSSASDVKAIDSLASKAVASGTSQMHFYVVSLDNFASAQGLDRQAQLALERSGGRFSAHELKSQYTEELISASIGKLVPASALFGGASAQHDHLLTVAMELWEKGNDSRITKEWIEKTIVQGCFPLHPLTTYCLPRLNHVLAQNERTMFRFIQDDAQGLRHFIETTDGEPNEYGWMPLLALDHLFPYFETTLKDKREDLWQAYLDACSRLAPHELEHGLEGRVLRALVLLEVVGDPKLRANLERLSDAVNLPPRATDQLTAALEKLEESEITYPSAAGFYQLNRPGQANPRELRRRITQHAQKLDLSPASHLNARYGRYPIIAKEYNSSRGSSRSLAVHFATRNELESPATVNRWQEGAEGVAIYAIASSQQEIDELRTLARNLTRKHAWLVVSVPRVPTLVVQALKSSMAVAAIKQEEKSSSQGVHDILARFTDDYTKALNTALDAYDKPQDLEWYFGGQTIGVTTQAERSALASRVVDQRFPFTPAHNQAQHLRPGNIQAAVRTAMKQILTAPFKLAQSRNAAAEAVLRSGALPLGLIYNVQSSGGYDEYDVKEPLPADSHKVWNLIRKNLEDQTPWGQIVQQLLQPPYGLYPNIVGLFVATFFRIYRDSLTVSQKTRMGSQQVDVTEDVISKLVEKASDYTVLFEPLPDWEQMLLRSVEQALPASYRHSNSGSLRMLVAESCRNWARASNPLAQNVTAEDLARLSGSTSVELFELAYGFRQLASLPNREIVAAALQTQLPILLGLPEDHSVWDEGLLTMKMADLRQACLLLDELPSTLRSYLGDQIGRVFGATEPPLDEKETFRRVREWHSKLTSKNISLSTEAGFLLSQLRNNPYDLEQVFLKTLAHRWTSEYTVTWKKMTTVNTYLERLAIAVKEIERASQGSNRDNQPPRSRIDTEDVPSETKKEEPKEEYTRTASQPTRVEEVQIGSSNKKVEQTSNGVSRNQNNAGNGDQLVEIAFKEIEEKVLARMNRNQHLALLKLLNEKYGAG